MAHVLQNVESVSTLKPLIGERLPWVPHAQLVFTDFIAVDEIGVGDTGGFQLKFVLPTNAVYVLQTLQLSMGNTTDVANWDRPGFRYFWSPDVGTDPGTTLQMDMGMQNTALGNPNSNAAQGRMFSFGGGDRVNSGSDVNCDTQSYFNGVLPMFGGYGSGIAPMFFMDCPTASTAAQTIGYVCIFNVYKQDAPTYANFMTTYSRLTPGGS